MRIKKSAGIMLLLFFVIIGTNNAQIVRPDQIPGLSLWLRADSAVVLNGTSVEQWSDCSGNTNNAVQTTTTSQPEYITNSLNGLPALRFNGTTSFLEFPSGFLNNYSNLTLFLVIKPSLGSNSGIFAPSNDAGVGLEVLAMSGVHELRISGNIKYSSGMFVNNAFTISDFIYNASTTNAYENGTALAPATGGAALNYNGVYALGRYAAAYGSYYSAFDIAEIIIYNQALSNQDRITVEDYLYKKYSTPISLGPDIYIPYGFCDTLLAAGNAYSSYLWSTGETTSTIQANASGAYSVMVTDTLFTGYISRDTVNVYYPEITMADTIFCLGDSIILTTGLTGNYTYNWSNGATTPAINVTTPGNYWATVTDINLCSRISDTVTIYEDSFALTVSLGQDTNICSGNIVGLQSPAPAPPDLVYLWSNSATTPEVAVLSSGVYSLTVTNSNGCIATDEINVTIVGVAPEVGFSYNGECSGDSIMFLNNSFPAGNSWLWDFGEGDSSDAENPLHIFAGGGDYNIRLTVADGLCMSFLDSTLHIIPRPTAAFTLDDVCVNYPYNFLDESQSSEGAVSIWLWNFGDGSPFSSVQHPQHTYTAPGIYDVTLTVQTDFGCVDSISHQITVVGSAPSPSAFTLYQPADNFVTANSLVNFAWNSPPEAVSYILEYSTDPLFMTGVISVPSLMLSNVQLHISQPGNYFWRVKAYGLCGDSTISDVFFFSIFSANAISGMQLWLRADSGVILNGSTVSQWNDCSGNNHNARQDTLNCQPTFVPDILNELPVVRFNGINSYMDFASGFLHNYSDVSVFFVIKPVLGANAGIFAPRDTALVGIEILASTGAAELRINGNTKYADGIFTNNFSISVVEYNANSTEGFHNGVALIPATGGAPLNYNGIYALGKYAAAYGSYYSAFDIAEIIIYNQALSNQDRITVEDYLYKKYSTPISLGPDIYIPYGFCDTLLAAGNAYSSYLWSTGETTSTIQANASGAYSVMVTDTLFTGYISRDTVNVYYPEITMADTIFCLGDSIILTTGLTGNYTYNWSNGATTPAINVTTPGNYWATVTDINLCSRISDTVTIYEDSFALTVSLGQDTNICSGNIVGLQSPAPAPPDLVYLWSNSATTPEVAVLSSGVYSLTVTNSNGCIATDEINVTIVGVAPEVGFSYNGECSGDSIMFLNNSFPAGNSWLWDFGEGDSSDAENPLHIFAGGGDYNIRLTVADGLCMSFLDSTLHIIPRPTAAFTLDDVCVNYPYNFLDESQSSEGAVSIWLWNFGDGSPFSSVQHPQHTYTAPGIYDVTLTVQTDFGCVDSISHQITVVGSAPSPSAFTLYQPADNFVTANSLVNFAWNSPPEAVSYILEYSTDPLFMTGVISVPSLMLSNVQLHISQPGNYFWRVKAYGLCGDSTISDVFFFSIFSANAISGMQLWLRADSGVILNGSTVSQWNDFSGNSHNAYQNTIGNQPSLIQDVLNGLPVLRFNGVNSYLNFASGFLYNVSDISVFLVIKPVLGMNAGIFAPRDTALTGIEIMPMTGAAELRINGNTKYSGGIFSNEFSISAVQYNENSTAAFRNGISLSPLTGGNALNYNGIYALGKYAASYGAYYSNFDMAEMLIFTAVLGNEERKMVEKYLDYKYAGPPVNLGSDINVPYGFCGTLLDAGSRFTHFLWSTGDTTQTFGPTQGGTYSVTATDIFGFLSTDSVQVIMPSLTIFQDTTVCLGDTLHFSVNLGNDYSYLWLPDSITTNTFTISQPGTYSLTVFDTLGCQRTQTFTVVADSFPVQASLGPDRNICQGDNISLQSGAQQAVSYHWSDNSGNSYLPINGTPGTTPAYSVTVTNANGCTAIDTIALHINGVMPAVAFSHDSVCEGSATHFTDLSSVTPPYTIASRLWDFGDSATSTAQNPVHVYAEDGIYPAVLTVVTDSGCMRTFQQDVKVFSMPAVNFLPYEGCSGVAISFADNTACPFGNLTGWHWIFGDTYGTGNDTSVLQNPVYTYDSSGTYLVRLIAASAAGCIDSAAHTITIKKSPAVAFSNTPACAGNLVYFTNETIIPPWETITHYEWQFGDGTVSSGSNPSHIFDTAGIYDVTLTVRSLSGCEVSATMPVVIGAIPVAAFGYANNCIQITSQFSDSSTSTQGVVNQWEWDFGGLGTSSLQNPGFMFPDTGNYVVSLTVATDHGCADSTSATIRVYPLPIAAFDLDPEYGIPPLPVSFTNLSVGAGHFLWAFGDGDTDTVAEPVHTFLLQGIYPVLLTAYSVNGCYDTVSHNAYVLPTSVDIAVRNATLTLQDNRLTVAADLLNIGSRKIEHIDIAMQMENGSIIHEQWYGALMQGEFAHYVFNAQPEIPAGQRVDFVCITASLLPELEEVILENNRSCPVLESNFSLSEPYPNPVAGNVVIGYVLPFSGEVSIELYNEMGEKVTVLFNGERPEGYNAHTFDMSALVGGVHALKVIFHDNALRKKFVKM